MWIVVHGGYYIGGEYIPEYAWFGPFSTEEEAQAWNKSNGDNGGTRELTDPATIKEAA